MRGIKIVVSCLLLTILVFCVCTSYGETGYVALKMLLSSEDQGALFLGNGESASDEESNEIWAVYNEKGKYFYLAGINEYNKGEITVWHDIELLQGYYVIYSLSNIWNTLLNNIEKGYSITLAITEMEQVEGDWIIDDAESAASFVSVFETAYGSLLNK